jgi:hypothetical protein
MVFNEYVDEPHQIFRFNVLSIRALRVMMVFTLAASCQFIVLFVAPETSI